MTTDLRDEAAKNGVVRRHATGVMRAAAVGPETADVAADLAAMCHHVADLARTRPEPPSRIRLEHLGTALEIEWTAPVLEKNAPASGPVVGSEAVESSSPRTDSVAADAADDGLQRVCAPMIGTFYHSPEPGAPPFVAVGDSVVPGQRIGILEVMKMMSPVEAQVAGIVREVLVPDGGAVEFQQPLIVVEPAGGR